jgi:hypothetical protein
VKKLIVVGAGFAGASATVMALVASGVAGASPPPNVTGQTLSEARATLTTSGATAVVSTAVGDQKDQSDCVVTRQQARTVPAPINTSASPTTQVLLSLNCDATAASATTPGYSAGSPEGRAAAAAAAAATPTPRGS